MPLLVLQAYGHMRELQRASFCILSYLAHKKDGEQSILLFTDQPDYFNKSLKGAPIEFSILTPERIRSMRGKIDFLHRMKIALIEEAFQRQPDQLWYVDSDTFFTADPTPIAQRLSPVSSIMHCAEHPFDYLSTLALPAGEPFRAFYKLITSHAFQLADGSSVNVSPSLYSWNAGVMFFHSSHAYLIPDVYALTDQFYPPTRNHASEQYAFSIMLQLRTTVLAAESVIYHYWYRVKKSIMDEFLDREMNNLWMETTLSGKLDWARAWSAKLPSYFDAHVFTLRDDAIQAFNEHRFGQGYRSAFRAILKNPASMTFLRDVLYHSKQFMSARK